MNARQFITEDEIDMALDFLHDNADAAAKARAERGYLEDYLKVVEAMIMHEHDDKAGVIQKRNAHADPRYSTHLATIRTAVEIDEKARYLREAAKTKIDAWQTMSANERAGRI
jgi:hypothetical protein